MLREVEERLAERGVTLDADRRREGRAGHGRLRPRLTAPGRCAGPIERRIENPLAKRILAGEFSDGDHVEVDYADGEYVFHKGAASEEAREPVGATAS